MSGEIYDLPQMTEFLAERQKPLTLSDIQQQARDLDIAISGADWPVIEGAKFSDTHPLVHEVMVELRTQLNASYEDQWVNWEGTVYQIGGKPEHTGTQYGRGYAQLLGLNILSLPLGNSKTRPMVGFGLGGVGFLDAKNNRYLPSCYFCPAQSVQLVLKQTSDNIELLEAGYKLQSASHILTAIKHELKSNLGTPDLSMLGYLYDHLPNGEIKQACLDYLSATLDLSDQPVHVYAEQFFDFNWAAGAWSPRSLADEPLTGIDAHLVSVPEYYFAGGSSRNEVLGVALEGCAEKRSGVFLVVANDVDHYEVIPTT